MTAATLPTAAASGPAAALRNTGSLMWRSLVRIKHNPTELLDLSVQPVMFLLLFTFVFGGQLAGSPGQYLQYALSGLIVQNTLFTALNTAVGLHSDVDKGVFDRLRSLPIARSAPLVGRIVADLGKQLWAVALMLGLGMLIGFDVSGGVAGAVAAVALLLVFTLAMSWLTVMLGLTASSEEKVMILGFTVVMPLSFTSSAFVRPETLPGYLQWWVDLNPVTYLVDATRGLLAGTPEAGPIGWTLVWAAGLVLVFFPLAMRAYRARLS